MNNTNTGDEARGQREELRGCGVKRAERRTRPTAVQVYEAALARWKQEGRSRDRFLNPIAGGARDPHGLKRWQIEGKPVAGYRGQFLSGDASYVDTDNRIVVLRNRRHELARWSYAVTADDEIVFQEVAIGGDMEAPARPECGHHPDAIEANECAACGETDQLHGLCDGCAALLCVACIGGAE